MAVQIEFLKNIPYFTGVKEEDLESIKKLVTERVVDRAQIITLDGEPARALYIVVSGAVKIFKTSVEGKEQILSFIRPGESFNDVPIFDDGLTFVSAQAMGPVTLYEISKEAVNTIIQKYPRVATNVIHVLASRVRSLVALVEELSFKTVISRVAKILMDNATDGKSPGHRLTQQEMAAMAGTAREVVGRSLKALEERGIIKLDRQRIIIKNKEELQKMIGNLE